MRRRGFVLAWALCAAAWLGVAFLAACARNPVTGRPEMVLVSTEKEREIGREEAEKVEAQMGLADHATTRAYVRSIGARLAAHSPRTDVEYTFDVVDTPEPNAFALPGGPVYVSRGLLALANSEDELAGVIGHEIGHIAARHVVQRVSATAPWAILVGIPSAIVGSVSRTLGDVVAAPGALAGGLVLASHSRGQELEADRIGMKLAADAGYDPSALARILETMEREAALVHEGEQARPSFFDSHPATQDRVAQAAGEAGKLTRASGRPLAPDRNSLLARLEGLLVGENPAAGVFLDERFAHPVLDFSIDFPAGWQAANQPLFVVAAPKDQKGKVFAVLQVVTEGEDPREGPRVDGLDERLVGQLEVLRVNGLPATRILTERRDMTFELTWIAHGGTIYRVVCVAPTGAWARYGEACEGTSRSFRRLRAEDRVRIREARLRIEAAQRGERVSDLATRTGSQWTADEIAVANALSGSGVVLNRGVAIKVAVSRRYQPPSR